MLMMGNLSVGLKKHAVMMFEVGRLEHDQIESLAEELRAFEDEMVDFTHLLLFE